MLAERLLAPVRDADVDALLLGCTHYPYLARVIGDVMGRGVTLVSSADETAFAARRMLGELGLLRTVDGRAGAHRFLSSGDVDVFRDLGARLLGPELDHTGPWLRPRLTATRGPPMPRPDGRARRRAAPDHVRARLHRDGRRLVLVSFGRTRVLCTASIDDDVPRWMRGTGKGWVTAEYSMLPGSSPERVDREAAKGKQSGRTVEIQRLIGAQPAGGVRHAAARRASGRRRLRRPAGRRRHPHGEHLRRLPRPARRAAPASSQHGGSAPHPLHSFCAAISVGIVDGVPVLDLPVRRGQPRPRST